MVDPVHDVIPTAPALKNFVLVSSVDSQTLVKLSSPEMEKSDDVGRGGLPPSLDMNLPKILLKNRGENN